MGCSNKGPAAAISIVNKTYMQELVGWRQAGKNVLKSFHWFSLEGALRLENNICKKKKVTYRSALLDLVGKSVAGKNCTEDATYLLVGLYGRAGKSSSDVCLVRTGGTNALQGNIPSTKEAIHVHFLYMLLLHTCSLLSPCAQHQYICLKSLFKFSSSKNSSSSDLISHKSYWAKGALHLEAGPV